MHSLICWGYCFTEAGKPGKLDPQKAYAAGVPRDGKKGGPLLGKLKNGQEVTVEVPAAEDASGATVTRVIRP